MSSLSAALLGVACGLCYIGVYLLIQAVRERRRLRCGWVVGDGFGGACSCTLPDRHRGVHLCKCGEEF